VYPINGARMDCSTAAAGIITGRPVPARSPQVSISPEEQAVTIDGDSTAEPVISRYSALARAALAAAATTDSGADGFGGAACTGAAGLPEAAPRASLGCGNPLAVADLQPGETVPGPRLRRRARRLAPGPQGRPGRHRLQPASSDMLAVARASTAQAGIVNAIFVHGRIQDMSPPWLGCWC